jgi:small ligand-binding sensory domain FIST
MAQQLRFASALTFESDVRKAAGEIGGAIQKQLGENPVDLAILFPSSHFSQSAHDLLDQVRDVLSPGVLVGCTGESVIGPDSEIESEAAIAVVAASMPGVTLQPIALSPAEISEIAEAPNKLLQFVGAGEDTKAFVMVGDPFSANVEGLLRAFNTEYAGVPVIGGLASGAHSPGETALLLNDHTYREGAVCVAMAGPIQVDTIVSQGCRPIGPLLTVTGSDANVITRLDDMTALIQIQELIDELPEKDKMLLKNGLFVGRAIDSTKELFGRGDFLVRGVVGMDRRTGSIAIGDFVKTGEAVQFHVRDADTAKEDLEMMLTPQSLFGKPSGGLLFSCNGRGTHLYGHADGDISAINAFFKDMPVAGFFCAGEFGPIGGKNFLHGHTASLALIRPTAVEKAD